MHAEDHYWDGRRFKTEGGKAFKSVSLGELEMDDRLRFLSKKKRTNKGSIKNPLNLIHFSLQRGPGNQLVQEGSGRKF